MVTERLIRLFEKPRLELSHRSFLPLHHECSWSDSTNATSEGEDLVQQKRGRSNAQEWP